MNVLGHGKHSDRVASASDRDERPDCRTGCTKGHAKRQNKYVKSPISQSNRKPNQTSYRFFVTAAELYVE